MNQCAQHTSDTMQQDMTRVEPKDVQGQFLVMAVISCLLGLAGLVGASEGPLAGPSPAFLLRTKSTKRQISNSIIAAHSSRPMGNQKKCRQPAAPIQQTFEGCTAMTVGQ